MRIDNRQLHVTSGTLLALFFSLWATSAPGQQEARHPAFEFVTSTPVVLSVVDPQASTEQRELEFRTASGAPPASFLVVEARLAERPEDFSKAFTPEPIDLTKALPRLPMTVSLDAIPFAGTYTVKLRPVREGKPSPEDDVQLRFLRPSARLAAMSPLYLRRTAGPGDIEPPTVLIKEDSSLAFASFAWPLVTTQLRGPAGETLAAELRFSADGPLAAGKRLELKPVLSGSVPFGESSGTLRLESPQLASPVDVEVKFVNRVWSGFLPITIIASVLLGLAFRQILAKIQESDEALLEAQKVRRRLEELALSEVETGLQEKIRSALLPLVTAIESREGPEKLRQIAEAAGKSVDEARAEAEKARGASRTEVATLKGWLGQPAGHAPGIAELITAAHRNAENVLRELDKGYVRAPAERIASLKAELAVSLERALADLRVAVTQDMKSLGPWPETQIPEAAAHLEKALQETEPEAPGKELADTVQAALKLSKSAHAFFVQTVRPEVLRIARQIELVLLNLPGAKILTDALAALREAAKSVSEPASELRGPPYPTLASAVVNLGKKLEEAVRAIHAKAVDPLKGIVDAALEKGEYVKAATARSGLDKLNLAGGPPGMTLSLINVPLPSAGEPGHGPRRLFLLIGPAEVSVGQPIEYKMVVEPALPPGTAVSWSIQAGHVREAERGDTRLVLTALSSGKVRVSAELRDPTTQDILWAESTTTIRPSATELAALTLRQRLFRRELLMTAIIGVFIAAGGTLLFVDSFFGSWRDFFIAALWGFTVDVGASKLRELAQPLSSRQIPLAGK